VDIKVTGAEFKIRSETIREDVRANKQPTRLGITLTRPVTHALVSVTVTPTHNALSKPLRDNTKSQ